MRWLESRDDAIDAALAVAAAALNVTAVLAPDPSTSYDFGDSHGLGAELAAACGLALLWRRRRPLVSFLAIVSLTGAVASMSWDPGSMVFTVAASGYALGAFGTLATAGTGIVVTSAWLAVLVAVDAPYLGTAFSVAELSGVLVAVWLLGQATARRRVRAEQARADAVALARDGARETERSVLAERLRVARELNGVVSDTLAAITLQAASAPHDADGRAVLESIERASRAATADLRRMLRALRGSHDVLLADGDEAALHAALLRETGWGAQPAADPGEPDRQRVGRWPVDVAMAVGVAVLNVAGSVVPDDSTTVDYAEPFLPALVALAAIPGLALVVRRRYPVLNLIAAVAVLTTVDALAWQTGTLPGSVVLATYALGAWAPPARGAVALLATHAGVAAGYGLGLPHHDDGTLWEALVLFTVPWVIGAVIRHRREADRRDVEQLLAAEREHAAATERALADERLSIARDLHDLVSHNLAAITVQAAVAHRNDGTPATEALAVIEAAGRAGLTDLRRMLDAVTDADQEAALTPSPGLRELEELVDLHRKAHGPIQLTVDDAIAEAPDSIRLTTYRLVQEALTNVAKHAHGAPTTVSLRSTEHGLVVNVENEPPQPLATKRRPSWSGSGLGLAGMRERAAVFGGVLAAGATASGGFLVTIELPSPDPG